MQQTSDSVITFHCRKCNAKLRIPTKLAGVEGPCPKCKAKITAPLSMEQRNPSDQDDTSVENNHPNEIIRKKFHLKKNTHIHQRAKVWMTFSVKIRILILIRVPFRNRSGKVKRK